jgi:hypothetical protein
LMITAQSTIILNSVRVIFEVAQSYSADSAVSPLITKIVMRIKIITLVTEIGRNDDPRARDANSR